MDEVLKIYEEIKKMEKNNELIAMATVISTKGSVFRRAGARMLISQNGEMKGMVGGGCFDEDIKEIGLKVIDTGIPELRLYDLSGDEMWGLGLGCNGSVYVLIESLNVAEGRNWIAEVENSIVKQRRLLIEHHINHPLDFSSNGHTGETQFNRQYNLASPTHKNNFSNDIVSSSIFAEVIEAPPRLVIFGAGEDVVPLVKFAGSVGFRIVVIDQRKGLLNDKRFPQASKFICARAEEFKQKVRPQANDFVLFMSHKIEYDAAAFYYYSGYPVSYFGFLGPKKRSDQIIFDILNMNRSTVHELREKVYSPVGIDIGAETPEEIAISIISELMAVRNNTSPKFLRDKRGSIHETSVSAPVYKIN